MSYQNYYDFSVDNLKPGDVVKVNVYEVMEDYYLNFEDWKDGSKLFIGFDAATGRYAVNQCVNGEWGREIGVRVSPQRDHELMMVYDSANRISLQIGHQWIDFQASFWPGHISVVGGEREGVIVNVHRQSSSVADEYVDDLELELAAV